MTDTPVLGIEEHVPAQALEDETANEAYRFLEQVANGAVVKDLAAPPGAPADGDAYIVPAGATGAWSTHDGEIAFRMSTQWLFITPRAGLRAHVQDEHCDYRHDGTGWRPIDGAPITASEAIGAGLFGNIHASAGVKVRKANATDDTKPCDCYVPAAIANAAVGGVLCPGQVISGLSGLTPGADYWLDTAGGGITDTPPAGAGNLVQKVGKAVSATQLFFNPQPGVTL